MIRRTLGRSARSLRSVEADGWAGEKADGAEAATPMAGGGGGEAAVADGATTVDEAARGRAACRGGERDCLPSRITAQRGLGGTLAVGTHGVGSPASSHEKSRASEGGGGGGGNGGDDGGGLSLVVGTLRGEALPARARCLAFGISSTCFVGRSSARPIDDCRNGKVGTCDDTLARRMQ